MNEHSDMERVLRHWFDDGPSTMPDRVVDVVADRIGREHQRPAWRLRWRPYQMNTIMKVGAALAAVLVVALVGWNMLSGRSPGVGGSASPSPSPSVAPSVSPAASAARPWWDEGGNCGSPIPACGGALAVGTHSSRNFKPAVTFTVPAGWVNNIDWAETGNTTNMYLLFPDTPANQAEYALSADVSEIILLTTNGRAHDEDFGICRGTVEGSNGTTTTEITETLVASKNLVTSESIPVTIGGLSGRQIDVRLDPAWTGTCPLDPEDPPDKDFKDIRSRFFVLDTSDGGNVVIRISSFHAANFDAFLPDAMSIVESFRFETGASPSPS